MVRLLRKAGVRRLDLVVATRTPRATTTAAWPVLALQADLLLDGGDGTRDRA